jgi:hypothetical protein
LDPKLLTARHAIALVCAAILAGAALQALVLWLGLRAINSTLSAVTTGAFREAPTATSGSTGSALQPASSAAPPNVAEAQRTERDAQLDLRDRLINGFLAQKAAYAKACFATHAGLPRRYTIEFKIDAAGEETERIFRAAEGEEPKPELDACLRNQKLPPLRVNPLGKPATGLIQTRLP